MISIDKVSKVYPGGFTGLHETSLRFEAGEFTVLLGASGAGKSTLLRCLNLLEAPGTGCVSVEGIGTLSNPAALRRHRQQTGMIFQRHQLIGRYTALENVLIGRIGYHSALRTLLPFGRREQEAALDALERVGLLDKAMCRVDRLSGGQQQRVGVARALAQAPRVILADEPVASLDPASADGVLTLLRDICRERKIAVIASLHQVGPALRFSDRIVALSRGRVILDQPSRGLCDREIAAIYQAAPLDTAEADAGFGPGELVLNP
jgi:phosphonate transport system ATP-binding protein